jgi:hypothetical protein
MTEDWFGVIIACSSAGVGLMVYASSSPPTPGAKPQVQDPNLGNEPPISLS